MSQEIINIEGEFFIDEYKSVNNNKGPVTRSQTNKKRKINNVNNNSDDFDDFDDFATWIPSKKTKKCNEVYNEDNEDNLTKCMNPFCDHKNYTNEELLNMKNGSQYPIKEIGNIDDLIELGKTYHCKKNLVYYGINLKILFNLVEPLTELKNMIGMKTVKENIINHILFFLQGFNQKDKCSSNCVECLFNLPCTKISNSDMLHTVITGPPGVGKTELGKILGKVYKGMGILSKGHMNIVTRADLIGKYLGHTSAQTQAVINKSKGGVLFIDEAYSLGNEEGNDSFSKECIDTINNNLTETKDLLVIIAGYADSLEKCFFNYNPGLKRRFTFRYDISSYSWNELMDIFLLKVKKDTWVTEFDIIMDDSDQIKKEKESNLKKLKTFFSTNSKYFPHFGGDLETFFLNCKIVHCKRVLFSDAILRKIITITDIEKGFLLFMTHRKYKIDDENSIPISVQRMYL